MKPEDAIKMIELCLESVNDKRTLMDINQLVFLKLIDVCTPKKRNYTKKELANVS